MSGHTERAFEKAIEAGLTSAGGYEMRNPSAYDEALALLPADVTGFLKESQPARWQALEALLGLKTAATVLDSLSKELELKGTLHVLRHGFKCYGKTFRMAWFRPNTRMNPEAAENYAKNRLTITRQVAFTSVKKRADGKNRRCVIDVTLAVNGIPGRHRRTEEPADRAAGRRCDAPVPRRAGRARSSLRLQAARSCPFRGGSGRGVDDDTAEGPGDRLPALQPGQRPRGGQPAGRGELEDPLPLGRGAGGRQPPGKSCNASCISK